MAGVDESLSDLSVVNLKKSMNERESMNENESSMVRLECEIQFQT